VIDVTIIIVSSLFHLVPVAMNPFPPMRAQNVTTDKVCLPPGSTTPYTRVPASEEALEHQSVGNQLDNG